jgi:predicted dehydrogenase
MISTALSESVRLAFLGCGFITRVHSRQVGPLGGDVACSCAIADPSVDAIVVAVPPTFHVDLTPEMSLARAVDDQRLLDQIYVTAGLFPE